MKLSEKVARLYPVLLLLVMVLHGLVLLLKYSPPRSQTDVGPSDEQLIVKILREMPDQKRQIVQSEEPDTKTTPKDEAALSDKDRSFDRETRARKVETFKKAAKGGVASQGEKPQAKKDMKLSDLGLGEVHPMEEAAKKYAEAKNQKGEAGKPGQEKGDLDSEALVSSTNDYVDKVPIGEVTHLNTVEYKYYGFYHRIRQKLEQFWGRSIHEKAEEMVREGRRLIASEDLITALRITLNSEGEIVDIKVLGTSGVKELDDAAIESFNEAGPFPNPPRDLVVNDRVTLEWGFVVQT
jgi:TonB family protein